MSIARGIAGPDALLDVRVRVPQSVVYRAFVQETVILNLDSGRYHGVNSTGGRIFETLDRLGSVREAALVLARDYDRSVSEIEIDVCVFCQALLERELLVIDDA